MPAVRIPPVEMSGRRQTGQHAALAPRDAVPPSSIAARDPETGGRLPALAGDTGVREGYPGGYSASMASVEVERPFSPTELGLPRLTSPDLQELPQSWQELVREAPRQRRGEYGGSYRPDPEMSAEWAASMGGGSSEDWSYSLAGDEMATPARRRTRRWPLLVTVLLMLLLAMNLGVLVVARPDLCPVSQCSTLSAKAHQYLPFLAQPTPTTPAVSGQPTSISINVVSGKSATASLQFKDISTGSVSWSAATGLSWVSVSPNRGAAQPGDSVALTLTADASAISAGTYNTTLTITAEGETVRVPVTISVQAGS